MGNTHETPSKTKLAYYAVVYHDHRGPCDAAVVTDERGTPLKFRTMDDALKAAAQVAPEGLTAAEAVAITTRKSDFDGALRPIREEARALGAEFKRADCGHLAQRIEGRLRRWIAQAEEDRAEFIARINEKGLGAFAYEMRRDRLGELAKAEHRAAIALEILRDAGLEGERDDESDLPHLVEAAARRAQKIVHGRLNQYNNHDIGQSMESRTLGEALRAAEGELIGSFSGLTWVLWEADRCEEARAELGLDPAPWPPVRSICPALVPAREGTE